jgi:hypothetical protein
MNPKEKPRCDYSKRNHPEEKIGIGNDKLLSKSFLNKIKSPAIIVIEKW